MMTSITPPRTSRTLKTHIHCMLYAGLGEVPHWFHLLMKSCRTFSHSSKTGIKASWNHARTCFIRFPLSLVEFNVNTMTSRSTTNSRLLLHHICWSHCHLISLPQALRHLILMRLFVFISWKHMPILRIKCQKRF